MVIKFSEPPLGAFTKDPNPQKLLYLEGLEAFDTCAIRFEIYFSYPVNYAAYRLLDTNKMCTSMTRCTHLLNYLPEM